MLDPDSVGMASGVKLPALNCPAPYVLQTPRVRLEPLLTITCSISGRIHQMRRNMDMRKITSVQKHRSVCLVALRTTPPITDSTQGPGFVAASIGPRILPLSQGV